MNPLPRSQEPTTGDLTYLTELAASDEELAARCGRSQRFIHAQYERAEWMRQSARDRPDPLVKRNLRAW